MSTAIQEIRRETLRKKERKKTNLEGGDDNVGGVDANRGSSSVALLNVDSVDVDDPLLPVDLKTKSDQPILLPELSTIYQPG